MNNLLIRLNIFRQLNKKENFKFDRQKSRKDWQNLQCKEWTSRIETTEYWKKEVEGFERGIRIHDMNGLKDGGKDKYQNT